MEDSKRIQGRTVPDGEYAYSNAKVKSNSSERMPTGDMERTNARGSVRITGEKPHENL